MTNQSTSRALWFALSILVLFLLWEAICRIFSVPAFILPPPSDVLAALWQHRDLLLGKHLWPTLYEVLVGLVASTLFGVLVALAMSFNRSLQKIFYPYVVISQTIPLIALSPIFILWFGYDLSGKIAITVLYTFFPVVVSTFDGLRAAEPEMIDLLRTMGASRGQVFRNVLIPSALPSFFSGFKVVATYSVGGAVVGEWLGGNEGLGYFARRASGNFQAAELFASILLLSLLGMLLFWVAALLERRFVRRVESKN
ncbi:MAG TPA: ABC transporter permease [Bacilli bacterium]|nr:ABC transporter permease [Bacilli bacterium]